MTESGAPIPLGEQRRTHLRTAPARRSPRDDLAVGSLPGSFPKDFTDLKRASGGGGAAAGRGGATGRGHGGEGRGHGGKGRDHGRAREGAAPSRAPLGAPARRHGRGPGPAREGCDAGAEAAASQVTRRRRGWRARTTRWSCAKPAGPAPLC